MLPRYEDDLKQDFTVTMQPGLTYALEAERERVMGTCDDLEAIKQSVYLILNTERYRHPIYSWNYGIELADLIGQPIPYVYSLIKSRIADALMQDDRILSVGDFNFARKGGAVSVVFKVTTALGEIQSEMEVQV